MDAPERTLILTKIEAATRQADAAIVAFTHGDFDIAITLAGAAEGMLEREGTHMFSFMRDSPRVQDAETREWIANPKPRKRLVGSIPPRSGPTELSIERGHAAIMIARAASKLEKWTPRMDEFREWIVAHADAL